MPESSLKVLVGVPCYGGQSPFFTWSLARVMVALARAGALCGDAPVFRVGSYIDQNRNAICLEACNADGCTHLLFIDHDMTVPADCAFRLAAHRKPVVGGWYRDKSPDHYPTAWELEPFRRIPDKGRGLQQVGGVPMGCTLIDVEAALCRVNDHFKEDGWWFALGNNGNGEDVHFSRRCKEVGVPVFLDNDLECGHVGEVVWDEVNWR